MTAGPPVLALVTTVRHPAANRPTSLPDDPRIHEVVVDFAAHPDAVG
ncbi:hypothetical protein [Microbacterium sp.]|nr:hypothetical protein [Microbacterium sp.]